MKRSPRSPSDKPRIDAPVRVSLIALAAVVGIALAVRLGVVLWLRDTVPYSDYFYYHDAARRTVVDWGLWFDRESIQQLAKLSWWPPGYPMFLALLYEIFGMHHRAAVFTQVLLGSAVAGLVYWIGLRATAERGERTARRVALIAATLVAINPTWAFMTNLLASENLFVFWLALGLSLALRQTKNPRAHVWTGVVLALATYTRAVALLVPLVVVWWLRRNRRDAWRHSAAWLLGAYVALLAPWTVRNAIVVGSPAIVCHGGGINFYYGHNPDGIGYRAVGETPMQGMRDPAAIDRRGLELGLGYITRHPAGFFERGILKIGSLFAPPRHALQANNAVGLPQGWEGDPVLEKQVEETRARQRPKSRLLRGVLTHVASTHAYAILVGAALALFGWRRLTAEMRLMAVLLFFWIGVHVVFWAQPRFRYPLEMFLMLLAAAFAASAFETLRVRRSKNRK